MSKNIKEADVPVKYDELEELGEIEWMHHRPETYIGTTNHPTHLFEEVFDNALDEVLAGGTYVEIRIQNGYCQIRDYGRGFPVGLSPDGTPYPVKACTKLYTSGKFNKNVKAYKISAGLNGIGLVAVTGLSDEVTIISHRDGYAHEYLFKTDFTTHKIDYVVKDKVPSNELGTSISFKPSAKIFRSTNFDIDYIKERVHLSKMLTKADVKLFVDDSEIDIPTDRTKLLHAFYDDIGENETYSFSLKESGQTLDVHFYYDFEKNEPRFKGSVNLLPIHDGTHIKYVKNIFSDIVKDFLPKNKVLVKSDYLIGLRCFIINEISEPRFSGQTKLKLDVDINRYANYDENFKKELNNILKNKIDTKALYERFLEYKQGLTVKKTTKKLKRRKFSSSLLDCVKEGPGTTLFIVEGESAAGSLMKCRDRNKHAIFTLFGKSMPNVEKCTNAKLLSNKTVTDLFNIFGKDLTPEVCRDIEGIKYDKIMITTDPDIDGYHIAIMIMRFFNKFFPKIIEEQRLLLPQIPLYGYYENKNFIPLYDLDEANKLMASGKKLMRHKGLGEFDPDELEVVLFKKNHCIILNKEKIEEMVKEENIIEENDNIDVSDEMIISDQEYDIPKFDF